MSMPTGGPFRANTATPFRFVGPGGFEPPTS
jgi:hypothetical protein